MTSDRAAAHTDEVVSEARQQELIREFDAESNFRALTGLLAGVVMLTAVALSLFHLYTAGFGLLNEIAHRTVHLAFVFGLIFLVFPVNRARKAVNEWTISAAFGAFYLYIGYDLNASLFWANGEPTHWPFLLAIAALTVLSLPLDFFGRRGETPGLRDFVFAAAGVGMSLYLLVFFKDIFIINVGSPQPLDYMFGVVAIIMVIEATRRTMGIVLPVIGILCLLYGLLGPYLPGVLGHRGYNILRIVNHLYIGTEGIYGIAVGVVATYVFHFVLFGVLAQATGLGQLFINLASILAGRYSGGPAKVSVAASGLFGMISGSPIANTVTTGAFTIPMMKRSGLSARFAAAVEASASCGGQVTPPIMGASAFVMTELLGIPYNELILIAIIPAAFHYFAAILMVHLEAKRLGLEGIPAERIPRLGKVLATSWHLLIPLIAMVTLLLMQFTPFLAAFWGILLTIGCAYLPLVANPLGARLDRSSVLGFGQLVKAFEVGAKYALGIGAACACVGFILGITTLTGFGFKFSAAVVDIARDLGTAVSAWDVTGLITEHTATLFFGLLMVGVACIIMGAGIPTTPTYIILASIAAPALYQLDVPLLATHFFVFYYGVLADVTPPVALAAYAGAGIAGSEPMRTGLTAFRLSMGKALVPFMFVYAPSLLFIDFTWLEFITALGSGMLGILALSAAYIGYFRTRINRIEKVLLTVAGLMLVANHLPTIAVGTVVVVAILGRNWMIGGSGVARDRQIA